MHLQVLLLTAGLTAGLKAGLKAGLTAGLTAGFVDDRCERRQPADLAAAAAVGPCHEASACCSVHSAAHADHVTLQIPLGSAGSPHLHPWSLLCGAGMPAQVTGSSTGWRMGGQTTGKLGIHDA
jgi:hypothetical protein